MKLILNFLTILSPAATGAGTILMAAGGFTDDTLRFNVGIGCLLLGILCSVLHALMRFFGDKELIPLNVNNKAFPKFWKRWWSGNISGLIIFCNDLKWLNTAKPNLAEALSKKAKELSEARCPLELWLPAEEANGVNAENLRNSGAVIHLQPDIPELRAFTFALKEYEGYTSAISRYKSEDNYKQEKIYIHRSMTRDHINSLTAIVKLCEIANKHSEETA